MSKSTTKRRTRKTKAWSVAGFKIERPDDRGFSLTPHASGKWQKKIDGKIYYFGNWARRVNGKLERIEGDGWQDALRLYTEHVNGAVGTPVVGDGQKILAEICDRFLYAKRQQSESGELSPRSYYEYKQATDLLISKFGGGKSVSAIDAADFRSLRTDMAKKWGPVRRGKFIQLIRAIFNFAFEDGLIKQPMMFGSGFKKPDKSVLRKHKAKSGQKLFAAQEIRDMLNGKTFQDEDGEEVDVLAAPPQMRAIILLGINAGLGNTDIGNLERQHLNLKSGWIDYPRSKTGLPRRAPLWAETVKALKEAIAERPTAKEKNDSECVFLNRSRKRLVQSTDSSHSDYVSSQFRERLRSLHINGRKGLGFYSLRHTFATIALQTGDRDAVKTIMGHGSHDMLSVYDETGPSDERLLKIVSHVHAWLFG